MAFCGKCGRNLNEEVNFCPECGTKIDNSSFVEEKNTEEIKPQIENNFSIPKDETSFVYHNLPKIDNTSDSHYLPQKTNWKPLIVIISIIIAVIIIYKIAENNPNGIGNLSKISLPVWKGYSSYAAFSKAIDAENS